MSSQEKFAVLADVLPEPMFLLEASGEVVATNLAAREFLNDGRELRGRYIGSFIHSSDGELPDFLLMCGRSKSLLAGSFWLSRGGGQLLRCRCDAGRFDSDGTLVFRAVPEDENLSHFNTLNRKVEDLANENRERRRAERQVRLLNSQLRAVIAASPAGIVFLDLDRRVRLINRAAEAILGVSSGDAVGKPLVTFEPQLNRLEHHAENDAPDRLSSSAQSYCIGVDGNQVEVAVSAAPARDSMGEISGFVLVVTDISERKRTEAALLKSEKLATAGRLAASIAHEINNPLEAITNLAYLLQYDKGLSPESSNLLSTMMNELRRVESVVKQTLGFYRESARPVSVRVSELIDSVISVLSAKIEMKRIHVTRHFEIDDQVEAYAGEIRQVIANLLVNAIDAVSTDGHIEVRVSSDAGGVCTTISDDGPGIPASHRARLFEPFFTTKADKGTGLGLWVVQEIVTRHGGDIRLDSSTDSQRHGTKFAIFLPRVFQEKREAGRATLAS